MTGPVRISFVGAGWWAVSNHIPRIKADPRARLAGVCRLGAPELRQVKDHFGFDYATEDFLKMLDEVPMDGLVISTPHRLHAMQALAAIERGIHVLIEKPMAVDPSEARAVVAAARARRVHALIPYGWNFKPFLAQARQWIAQGRIGQIQHVAGRMASPMGDLLRGRSYVGTEAEMFQPDPAMWADPVTGGYGWGQLIHLLGALFYLTDLKPTEAYGITGNQDQGGDLFNSVALRFSNGATGALSGAATLPSGSPFDLTLDFYGSEGVISLAVDPARLTLRRHDGLIEDVPLAPGAGAYECLEPVDRFIALCAGEAVENCGPPECGARAVEVVAAMHASAKSGRPELIGGQHA